MNDFRTWLASLAEVGAMIPASVVLDRLPEMESAPPPAAPAPDRLLSVKEAADRLGVDRRWLYRRADTLPFAKKIGPGTLRFSEKGLNRWMERR